MYHENNNHKLIEIADEIPYMHFKNEWKVKAVPPFTGAVVRYYIECNDLFISIYLDWFSNLGCSKTPYWEIYCADLKILERFALNEHEQMLQTIDDIFTGKYHACKKCGIKLESKHKYCNDCKDMLEAIKEYPSC